MFKRFIFLLIVSVIVPAISDAQVVNVGKRQTNVGVVFSKKDLPPNSKQQKINTDKKTVAELIKEDDKKVISAEKNLEDEVPPPPVAVTPEEIAELEIESKKSIRRSIKNKDDKDRQQLLGVMNWAEKNMKMQELIAKGMSYKEAKKIVEKTVKLPKMNIKKDKDIEKYIYKKGGFITNEQ